MDRRLEILESLKKEFMLKKEVSFGAYLAYVTGLDDLPYLSDEEMKRLIDTDIEIFGDRDWEVKPGDCNWGFGDEKYDLVTRKTEQLAYGRYQAGIQGRIFFQSEERLSYYDFLNRFTDEYHCYEGEEEHTKAITVINHNTDFYDEVPYRYVPMYVCARKGDQSTFIDTDSYKIPDAHELFRYVERGYCLYYAPVIDGKQVSLTVDADEWFALVFDAEGCVRATSYYKRAHFGMAVRPGKKEIEFYNRHQAIEIFHEWFAKCKTFIWALGEYCAEEEPGSD